MSAIGSNKWQAEWGAPILMSHGPNTSECGVAVLLPRELLSVCEVDTVYNDGEYRLFVLELIYNLHS